MKTYKIKYRIEHGEFTKDYLRKHDFGGCDGLIIHSILFPEDGSRSEVIVSCGANGNDLTPIEMWKSWIHMAYHLSELEGLDEPRRLMCKHIFDKVREFMLRQKDN